MRTAIGGSLPVDICPEVYNGLRLDVGDRIFLFGTGAGLDGIYVIGFTASTRAPEADGVTNAQPEYVKVLNGILAGKVYRGVIDGETAAYTEIVPTPSTITSGRYLNEFARPRAMAPPIAPNNRPPVTLITTEGGEAVIQTEGGSSLKTE